MVQGIGGVFLASPDPERLMQWFQDALGITMGRHGDGGSVMYGTPPEWSVLGVQKSRPDAPAPPVGDAEREPYGRQPMMVNLRVADLDAVVAKAALHGQVVGPENYEGMGRFAWTRTPDGHDVELWSLEGA